MKRLCAILLLILLGTAAPAAAQIPPEWQSAAQAVIGELERDTPLAAKPWTGAELTQGWNLARAWRRHNNGNIEIILAEYLMFVAVCRIGCAGSTIVRPPGQNSSTRRSTGSGTSATSARIVASPATSTGGGDCRPRPLAARSDATAPALNASAAMP